MVDLIPYRYPYQNSPFLYHVSSNSPISLENGTLSNGIAAGNYISDVYKIEITSPHTVPQGFTLVDFWSRNNASNLIGLNSTPEEDIQITQCSETQATLVGYAYFITSTVFGTQVNQWIPFDPFDPNNSLEFAYSLHVRNSLATQTEKNSSNLIKVYPNPSQGIFNLSLRFNESNISHIKIFNAEGSNIYSRSFNKSQQNNMDYTLDLSTYPNGIYFGYVFSRDQIFPFKLLKN